MFTELGSELILLPLTVVLKLFLILFYLKYFAKGTLNSREGFFFSFLVATETEEQMLRFDI